LTQELAKRSLAFEFSDYPKASVSSLTYLTHGAEISFGEINDEELRWGVVA
jgi:hypothetical protein